VTSGEGFDRCRDASSIAEGKERSALYTSGEGGSKTAVLLSVYGPSQTFGLRSKSSGLRGEADVERTCSELPCLTQADLVTAAQTLGSDPQRTYEAHACQILLVTSALELTWRPRLGLGANVRRKRLGLHGAANSRIQA
jgi:hypothetical protein